MNKQTVAVLDFGSQYTQLIARRIREQNIYSEILSHSISAEELHKKNVPAIKLNAGHDLNLQNLDYLLNNITTIKEVSIGHALVCDAFKYGLKDTIQKYLTITNR